VLLPDEADVPEFYGMPVFRRGNLLFGLLEIYDRPAGELKSSWCLQCGRLPLGTCFRRASSSSQRQAGEWDRGMLTTASVRLWRMASLRFYYGGSPHRPTTANSARCGSVRNRHGKRAARRLFGLTTTSADPGFLVTRPMMINGKAIEVKRHRTRRVARWCSRSRWQGRARL